MGTEKETVPQERFVWNELATSDVAAAQAFYGALFGWRAEPFAGDSPVAYAILKKGDGLVGGLMPCPEPGCPPRWVPYVAVEDVDAAAQGAAQRGGKVAVPPFDVPGAGRIAVLVDPQGAVFGVIRPDPDSRGG